MSAPVVINLGSGYLSTVLDRGIADLFAAGASDITIQSDDYVWAYVNRRHLCASDRRLDHGEMNTYVRHIFNSDAANGILGSGKPLDFPADIRPYLDSTHGKYDRDFSIRCRVNVTRCRVGNVPDGMSITMRTIPDLPPPWEALQIPADIDENFFPSQGMVLVVGITGSGKSTMLAAANRKRLEGSTPCKIITIEDPIEQVYARLPSLRAGADDMPGPSEARMPEVSQVELKSHLATFSLAAPNILRRKADVIVMGEMRDKESVETGLLLAQTGHATYATLHCETPAEAIARIVSEFPYDAQPSIANKLLDNLRTIVAQKIERDVSGKGLAFRSWCVFDRAFKEQLSEVPFLKWARMVRERMAERGHTFEAQALSAYRDGRIDFDAFARVAGFNPSEARAYLTEHGAMNVQ